MTCSIAWPNVWPRFKISRAPRSSLSSFTNIALMRSESATTVSHGHLRSGCGASVSSASNTSSPSMMPCFTSSARPSRRCFSESVASASTSQNTAAGSRNAPARFFPARRSTPVFPADRRIDHGDERRGDVDEWNSTHVRRRNEPEEVARDAAAHAHEIRRAVGARRGERVVDRFDRAQRLAALAEREGEDRRLGGDRFGYDRGPLGYIAIAYDDRTLAARARERTGQRVARRRGR